MMAKQSDDNSAVFGWMVRHMYESIKATSWQCKDRNPDIFPDEITVVDSGIEIPYGDVYGDQSIDVLDIVWLVADVLSNGNTLSVNERTRADINFDGDVNVTDCVAIIDIILGV